MQVERSHRVMGRYDSDIARSINTLDDSNQRKSELIDREAEPYK